MTKPIATDVSQPAIGKYLQTECSGVQPQMFTRHVIGFVLRGQKLIHYGDIAHCVNPGDMFYLSAGLHYIENIPDHGLPFEQITVCFTPEQLNSCLTQLSVSFGMVITDYHTPCNNCQGKNHVIFPSWSNMRRYFATLSHYIREGVFADDQTIENLKMMELVYMTVSNPECCFQSKMLENSDILRESFEQVIHNNIFTDCTVDDIAHLTGRSLTSFKKEFTRKYHESPHRWITRQRLMHARLMLISTSKSIGNISEECNFLNTSHFIKLFKKEFNLTPAVYRNRHHDHKGTKKLKLEK